MILANAADAGSMQIARHYAEVRHVPLQNVVALPLGPDETIDWHAFVGTLWEPLMERLVHDHWIDAVPMDLVDEVGRRKFAVNSHRIGALVVCRGVPLRIDNDPALYRENPPYTRQRAFQTNAASVDGELALLPQPNHPINAFVLNPLFQNDEPRRNEEQQVVKVSRLDGPTVADAAALVDRAIEAERQGLLGRAYVDLSDYDPVGNRWLELAASQLVDLGFDTDVDRAPSVIPAEARFDAPVLYFGWYTENIAGACALPGLRFPPGAIALHIHSYSAASMRSDVKGWSAPLIARGVTATVGNVYEPYLQLTHRPNLLVRALAHGATWVDAGYYALRVLSWQQVLFGDPLYRPFARSLDDQLAHRAQLPRPYSGYAVVRKANLLDRAHRGPEALALLREAQRKAPSPEIALALAARLDSPSDAAAGLALFAHVSAFRPDQWGMARTVAMRLAADGRAPIAEAVWTVLLDDLPAELQAKWLGDAINTARAAHDADRAALWEEQRRKLVPEH